MGNINYSCLLVASVIFCICDSSMATEPTVRNSPIIIDHRCTAIGDTPLKWVNKAKNDLKVWYGHTSHGSQITSGMRAMNSGNFCFSSTETPNKLLYQEVSGDLGHNGDLKWYNNTRSHLNHSNNIANVVMWSWCGGCSDNTEAGINRYLQAMTKLETEYPEVVFIYMTGHLNGSGIEGNLNIRNNQIRKYCSDNNKVLFDFADIESFDPDGAGFLELFASDSCDYDSSSDGNRDSNWCDEWVEHNPNHGIALPDSSAHTRPLNGALKGRAFWWLLARLAGWNGH